MDLTNQSLLLQARQGSDEAWKRMVDLYRPFIRNWLLRLSISKQDAPDLCQDILTTLVEHLPRFNHNGQPGAFRAWLRTVTTNRARLFWRAHAQQPQSPGGSAFLEIVGELEDPSSALSEEWNRNHQIHVLRSLLERLAVEFEPLTLEAFRRLGLKGSPRRRLPQPWASRSARSTSPSRASCSGCARKPPTCWIERGLDVVKGFASPRILSRRGATGK